MNFNKIPSMLLHLALKSLTHNSFICKKSLRSLSERNVRCYSWQKTQNQPAVSIGTKKPIVGINYLRASLDWSEERENQLYGPQDIKKKKIQRNIRK